MFQILKKLFHKNVQIDGKGNTGNFYDFPKCQFKIIGSNTQVNIDPSCRLSGNVLIYGDGNTLQIGQKSCLNGSIEIGQPETLFSGHVISCKMEIGKRVYVGKSLIKMGEDKTILTIGNDCAIASGTKIMCSDVHSILDKNGDVVNAAEKIKIGNHVWIGYDCKVLKNTTIPNDCVVAAGSIVTKVFDWANCLIAGTPAKIVKHNISWDKRSPNLLVRE